MALSRSSDCPAVNHRHSHPIKMQERKGGLAANARKTPATPTATPAGPLRRLNVGGMRIPRE
jgi:hypothetical protein